MIADVAESLSGTVYYTSRLTPHTPTPPHNGAGAILVDQGLVVASTWVQSVLLPHVLLGRAEAGGGFRQLAVSPPASLHVNRRVEAKSKPKHRGFDSVYFQAFGVGDCAQELR